MVKIRLKERAQEKPLYRIVIIEDSNQRDGKTIEDIGTPNPHTEPAAVSVKEDRVKYWLSVGAQPSNTVNRLLSTVGITNIHLHSHPIKRWLKTVNQTQLNNH